MKTERQPSGSPRQDDPSSANDFLVVGLGVAGGDVGALKDFFSVMPGESGMAFLVLPHCTPHHEDDVAEIIRRESKMPVHAVTEPVQIEPDKLYLIPTGKHLAISDGVIQPGDPIGDAGSSTPIDRFFGTLANAFERRAISVILGGTGTEELGTLGITAIKGRNGFVILQEPNDAGLDVTLRRAIDTKLVDVVVPVAEMPERLLSVRAAVERRRLIESHDRELRAINEELRAATNELETSKSVLRSIDEELATVNHDLKTKVNELARVRSDLDNLISSTDTAAIFLDRNLQINLYTPRAAEILNVAPGDIGRSFEHVDHSLAPNSFSADAVRVLDQLRPIEREVKSKDGRSFIARLLPYRGVDDKASGVVIAFVDITERVTAREEQLRLLAEITAAQFSDTVLEQMPAGLIVANANDVFVLGNRRMAEILRYPAGGARTEDYAKWDLRDRDGRPLEPERMPMARALRHGETIISEEMCLHHQGRTTVLSVNAAPIIGKDGEIAGGVLAFEDISRRVKAEAELRASEERYRTLFESIDEGFCIIEVIFDENEKPVDYRFLEISPSFEKQTGLKNAKGKTIREVVPTHEDYWFDIYGRIALTGEPARFENLAAGLDHWYDVYAFRFGAPEARQVGVLFNSINERKKNEEALRKSEERFRLMSESFTDYAIFMTDIEGRVLSWNSGAEQIFGYTDEEIIGRSAAVLFTPEDRESGVPEREMETARTHGRASDERWHLRKDGRRFYASGIMAALYERGGVIGFAKIARDLTNQKQAEEELRRQREELEAIVRGRTAELNEANEALLFEMDRRRLIEEERFKLLHKLVTAQEEERRRIARDMHDSLGQQLTALRLKLASMKNDNFLDPRIAASLETLQEMGRRIDSEVNFLVWELRPAVLDDLGLVAAIENYVREWSRHFGIPAEFHAGRFPRNERLDTNIETNLYRIAQEALTNVYKHSKAQTASVVIEMRKGGLVLVVEDDGIGFETDGIKRVHGSGSGLGLVGMRERAAIIGGTIEIESSPGQGTTVFVRVPLV
jgi:PAS domain S-box-containing protein